MNRVVTALLAITLANLLAVSAEAGTKSGHKVAVRKSSTIHSTKKSQLAVRKAGGTQMEYLGMQSKGKAVKQIKPALGDFKVTKPTDAASPKLATSVSSGQTNSFAAGLSNMIPIRSITATQAKGSTTSKASSLLLKSCVKGSHYKR